jgi:hypothetical protein
LRRTSSTLLCVGAGCVAEDDRKAKVVKQKEQAKVKRREEIEEERSRKVRIPIQSSVHFVA